MALFNNRGHVYSEKASGPIYVVGGQEVVFCADGKLRDSHDFSIIIDNNLSQKVAALVKADDEEQARRESLAQFYGGSDERMVEVFRRAIWYADGDEDAATEPSFFHDHGMFLVGRNAGGEFFANVIDGKCALYYTGNETFDDEGYVTPANIYFVKEWGYTGHG